MASDPVLAIGSAATWLRAVIGETKVLDLLPLAVYICDARDGTVQYCNQHAISLWGRRPEPGEAFARLSGATPMEKALETGIPVNDEEVIIERPDGSRVIALVDIEP